MKYHKSAKIVGLRSENVPNAVPEVLSVESEQRAKETQLGAIEEQRRLERDQYLEWGRERLRWFFPKQ